MEAAARVRQLVLTTDLVQHGRHIEQGHWGNVGGTQEEVEILARHLKRLIESTDALKASAPHEDSGREDDVAKRHVGGDVVHVQRAVGASASAPRLFAERRYGAR